MGNVAQADRGSGYFSWNNLTVGGSTPSIPHAMWTLAQLVRVLGCDPSGRSVRIRQVQPYLLMHPAAQSGNRLKSEN